MTVQHPRSRGDLPQLSNTRSRTGRRSKPVASQRPSGPKTNKIHSRWRIDRRTVHQRSGGDRKTQSGDVERSRRARRYATAHHAPSYRAPLHRVPPYHAVRALAPALRSAQRRLRSPPRDKQISRCSISTDLIFSDLNFLDSWRAPKTEVAPTQSGPIAFSYSMNGGLNFVSAQTQMLPAR